jgi:O-succinylbenzoic acid--CoA ligase
MQAIITSRKSYSFEEINLRGSAMLEGDDKAFKQTFDLAQQWLNGSDIFTFYTSGSTGVPKEIKLKRSQIEASAHATIEMLGLTADDHILLCMNTAFIGGAMLLIRGLILNASITLQDPSGDPLRHIPADHPYTFASFTPIQLHSLHKDNKRMIQKLNCFKQILVGGAAISYRLEQELKALSLKVYHTYGMTETVSHIALKQLGTDAFFKLLQGIDVRTDERGRLEIKSGATNQEWIHTNDVVRIFDERLIEILGRADDMINTGGIKVWPAKVEQALQEAVFESGNGERNILVSWVPDEKLGQQIIAVIEGATFEKDRENSIIGLLQQKLGRYELPREFYYVPSFATTESGKTNRDETLRMIGLRP